MNKNSYDVLRFAEHDDTCHIGCDSVEGEQLINYLKFRPHIEAGTLFEWIDSIMEQLRLYHKGRKQAYYYISPFSVIISKEGKAFLADQGSKENRSICQKMERRNIKEMFFPKETQSSEILGDNYSLGKTILYIVSASSVSESMKHKDKRYIKKITSKLMKNKRIRSHNIDRTKLAILSLGVLLMGIVINALLPSSAESANSKVVQVEAMDIKEEVERDEEKIAMQFHMGMLYLTSLENYDKAREIFITIFEDEEVAAHLADVSAFLGGKFETQKEMMLQSLDYILENYPEEEEIDPIPVLVQSYILLDTEEAYERVTSIIEELTEYGMAEITDYKLLSAYASALEHTKRLKESADTYEKILREEGIEEEEELYVTLIALYERLEEPENIYKAVEAGIKRKEESSQLRILHLRTLLKDVGATEEKIKQMIVKYKEELPEMMETKEYKLLASEYKIEEREGELWLER